MSMAEGEKVPILRGSQLTHGTRPRMVGTTIIRVAYGLDASDKGPGYEYVLGAKRAMHCFNTVFQPGRYLVQTFPWLRYVPAWFPGASFQRQFSAWRPVVSNTRDAPWAAAAQKRVGSYFFVRLRSLEVVALQKEESEILPPSMFSSLIERIEQGEEDEAGAKAALASAFLGEYS